MVKYISQPRRGSKGGARCWSNGNFAWNIKFRDNLCTRKVYLCTATLDRGYLGRQACDRLNTGRSYEAVEHLLKNGAAEITFLGRRMACFEVMIENK